MAAISQNVFDLGAFALSTPVVPTTSEQSNPYGINLLPGEQLDANGIPQPMTSFRPSTAASPTAPTLASPDAILNSVGANLNSYLGSAAGSVVGNNIATKYVVIVIGIVLVGGGVMMFRQTQTVIETAKGVSEKAALLTA